MKLSIITVNYNDSAGLRKTLASVDAQTYSDIEHIIIDAASTDESVDVINEYVDTAKHTVIWSSEKDKGIYDGMNKGIRKATGDYIQIVNSGDILASPDIIELIVNELAKHNYPELLFGNSVDYDNRGRKYSQGAEIEYSLRQLYYSTYPHETSFYRRELFSEDQYGLFDVNLRIASDWKWFLMAIGLGNIRPVYVNIDVVIFDTHGISSTNKALSYKERRQVLEELLPPAILADYDAHAFEVEQILRLRRYHLYGIVYLMERILFKLEKWHILRR